MGGVRDRRTQRGRSGSVTSSTAGFPAGADPQRESELSVATDNLTLTEIDGNVFRMSKDQVGGCWLCRWCGFSMPRSRELTISWTLVVDAHFVTRRRWLVLNIG